MNNKLAIDLGSLYRAEMGTLDVDAQAQTLGIAPGQKCPMDIFHAERHTVQSNFWIETMIDFLHRQRAANSPTLARRRNSVA